jgi:tRNA threonylcarbamoyladenosine biosynthesis protein TsaE
LREFLTRRLALSDPEATEALGAALARALPADSRGGIILLQGELGSGKSTLARAVLRALGHEGAVPSPTYTLVEPYSFPGLAVYHIDLYRISDEEELEFLGWSDLEDGLRLVEWPERVPGLVEQADLLVRLTYEGQGRAAEIRALSPFGQALLAGLPAVKES